MKDIESIRRDIMKVSLQINEYTETLAKLKADLNEMEGISKNISNTDIIGNVYGCYFDAFVKYIYVYKYDDAENEFYALNTNLTVRCIPADEMYNIIFDHNEYYLKKKKMNSAALKEDLIDVFTDQVKCTIMCKIDDGNEKSKQLNADLERMKEKLEQMKDNLKVCKQLNSYYEKLSTIISNKVNDHRIVEIARIVEASKMI